MADQAERTVQVRIRRGRAGARSYYETFRVTMPASATLLETLQVIRRDRDPSLLVRHSCHHASCGTCGMRVNGQERLACVTPLADLPAQITVEPLQNAPWLGDLVVAMSPFYAVFAQAEMPLLRTSENWAHSRPAPGVPALTRFESCLECGLCVSACPVAATDPAYLGPAALAAAWRVVQEPRGADRGRVLAWVDQEHGCWRCHLAFECSSVCPNEVQPGQAIAALRSHLLLHPTPVRETSRPAPRITSSERAGPRAWLALHGRSLNTWLFVLHRLTGLALVAYLGLHLWVLRLLTRGPAAWDAFIAVARRPLFFALDMALFFGVLLHGLNGARLALVGLGRGAHYQKGLAWLVLTLTAFLLLAIGVALARQIP